MGGREGGVGIGGGTREGMKGGRREGARGWWGEGGNKGREGG